MCEILPLQDIDEEIPRENNLKVPTQGGGVLMTKTLHQELEEILRGPVKTFIDPGGETRLSSQAISPLMEQLEHAFLEAAKRAKPTFAPEAGNGQARTAVNGYEYNLKREITGEEDYAV